MGLAGSVLAAPVAAQPPAATGVVVVRAAGDAGAPGGASAEAAGLGFVAGEAYVIAGVGAGGSDFVVSGAGGAELDARLVASDEAWGLGLLAVPGLTAPPYRFARDPARAGQEVYGATRDETSGTVTFAPGRVQYVQPGAAATDPDAVRHDAFDDRQGNLGAPLLNICGEVVGAVIDDANPAASGSGLAAPGAWLLARFAAAGLTATAVETACPTDAERAEAAEAAATEAARRAAAAEAAAVEAARRAATAEADASAAAERAAAAQAETDEAQQAAAAAAAETDEARQTAEAAAAARRQAERQAADRARYTRWIAVAGSVVAVAALLLWVVGRRSVANARQEQGKAETLAQAAQADLEDRDARERLASAVPAVFLDGADADGRPIALRIPGGAIADAAGAVVGRNPFESTVVLDHTEVSRRHFRLSARGTSVLIEDLDSMNGTMLDDVPLAPGAPVALPHGAALRVGGLALTVTLQS